MLLILGVIILLGIVFDNLINGWASLHVILAFCGLLLLILNFIYYRLPIGKFQLGKLLLKNILSILVLSAAIVFLVGLFPSGKLVSGDSNSIIKKADSINEKDGAQKALEYMQKASEGKEWNRNIALKEGRILYEDGKTSEAYSKFSEIFNKNSYDVEARYYSALAALKDKSFNTAVEQLKYNILIDPHSADSYMLLGETFQEMGDQIRGIFYYKLAVSEAPRSIEKRIKLAQAYASMQSFEEADAEYKAALDMASGFEEKLMVYNGYNKIKAQKNQEQAGEGQ